MTARTPQMANGVEDLVRLAARPVRAPCHRMCGPFDKLKATLRQAQGERYAMAPFFVPALPRPVRAEPEPVEAPRHRMRGPFDKLKANGRWMTLSGMAPRPVRAEPVEAPRHRMRGPFDKLKANGRWMTLSGMAPRPVRAEPVEAPRHRMCGPFDKLKGERGWMTSNPMGVKSAMEWRVRGNGHVALRRRSRPHGPSNCQRMRRIRIYYPGFHAAPP